MKALKAKLQESLVTPQKLFERKRIVTFPDWLLGYLYFIAPVLLILLGKEPTCRYFGSDSRTQTLVIFSIVFGPVLSIACYRAGFAKTIKWFLFFSISIAFALLGIFTCNHFGLGADTRAEIALSLASIPTLVILCRKAYINRKSVAESIYGFLSFCVLAGGIAITIRYFVLLYKNPQASTLFKIILIVFGFIDAVVSLIGLCAVIKIGEDGKTKFLEKLGTSAVFGFLIILVPTVVAFLYHIFSGLAADLATAPAWVFPCLALIYFWTRPRR